ncbi:MAG TPA: CPBP family intramembrane glutamic endopeptidase, partial [Vicinamibacterales bacterium]|nr:CPBP family intramembrane glutamic endopeptidase [Vicinamibacterales bacterium]
VSDTPSALPMPAQPPADAAPGLPTRWMAGLQAAIVCGIPTQLAISAVLALVLRVPVFDRGTISFQFFVILSLADTAAIALLIRAFLWMSGERPADVFVGPRPVRGEVLRGLALVPVVFLAVTGIVLGLRALVPSMHTVETNPFEAFLQSPTDAATFVFVVVLAGGVREELQRAFILHRFAQRLGGARVGLAIFSLTFGALHLDQGADVAVAIGLLGLLWGILYIQRRSAILPMVNHGAFNAVQVLQGVIAKSLGA